MDSVTACVVREKHAGRSICSDHSGGNRASNREPSYPAILSARRPSYHSKGQGTAAPVVSGESGLLGLVPRCGQPSVDREEQALQPLVKELEERLAGGMIGARLTALERQFENQDASHSRRPRSPHQETSPANMPDQSSFVDSALCETTDVDDNAGTNLEVGEKSGNHSKHVEIGSTTECPALPLPRERSCVTFTSSISLDIKEMGISSISSKVRRFIRSEVRRTSKSSTSFSTPRTLENHDTPGEYQIEKNVYGLFMLPNQHIPFGAAMLLALSLSLSMGITMIITIGVYEQYSSVQDHLRDMCHREGDELHCTPERLHALLDFAALDANGDGVWSQSEAREASMLPSFRALHEVVLEHRDLLETITPSIPSQEDTFCYYATTARTAMLGLFKASRIHEFIALGNRTQDASAVYVCAGPDPTPTTVNWTCVTDASGCSGVTTTPGMSSHDRYIEATDRLTILPEYLHRKVSLNVLRPCHLPDPELCGNAELRGLLSEVEMWKELQPPERVDACVQFVRDLCPRIFADQYAHFSVAFQDTCGDKQLTTEKVHKKFDFHQAAEARCTDVAPEEALRRWDRIFSTNPSVGFMWSGAAVAFGLPENASLTCEFGAAMDLCSETVNMVRADQPDALVPIGTYFGELCPETCCAGGGSFGCPSQCVPSLAHAVHAGTRGSRDGASARWVQGSFGQVSCLGDACGDITLQTKTVSGGVKIQLRGGYTPGSARIIVASSMTVRMYVIYMDLPAQSRACLDDRLEIIGERYCNSNSPVYVDMPVGASEVAQLDWLAVKGCEQAACGWELFLTDAGQLEEHTVTKISFALQDEYRHPVTGVTQPFYFAFFFMIVLVWVGFLCRELIGVMRMLQCALWCPDLNRSSWQRALLLAVVVVPRFVIWFWVLFVGVALTVSEYSFVEIVLNSVALAFILDIDELLFALAVPFKIKEEVASAPSYTWPSSSTRCFPSLDAVVVFKFGVLITVVAVITLTQYFRPEGFYDVATMVDCLCALEGEHCHTPASVH